MDNRQTAAIIAEAIQEKATFWNVCDVIESELDKLDTPEPPKSKTEKFIEDIRAVCRKHNIQIYSEDHIELYSLCGGDREINVKCINNFTNGS